MWNTFCAPGGVGVGTASHAPGGVGVGTTCPAPGGGGEGTTCHAVGGSGGEIVKKVFPGFTSENRVQKSITGFSL